jgi:hypothetical protein
MFRREPEDPDALESSRALDERLIGDLRAVGIHDLRELRAIGTEGAWERLFLADLRDTLRDALAIEGAVTGRRKAYLDPAARERLSNYIRRRTSPEVRRFD